jgi:DNA mismatch repair protein MutS
MAGFRDYMLEKYLDKMTSAGLTAVVYVQKKDPSKAGKFVREYSGVFSPGTHVSYEEDTSLSNNLMCIWIEHIATKKQHKLVCGMANAHIFTGETTIFEYDTTITNLKNMNTTTFDELDRYISVYNPSEIILVSTLSSEQTQRIVDEYLGLKPQVLHIHLLSTTNSSPEQNVNIENLINCTKQVYTHHLLTSLYGAEVVDVCVEFNTHAIATQAFCYMANFIQEHCPDMVKRLAIPRFNNTTTRMVLANHTLKQLNIIGDGNDDGAKMGRLSSLYAFLNRCCSPMGKRRYHQQITSPTFDEAWLNHEYEMTDAYTCAISVDVKNRVRNGLREICDMEKIMRQLVLRKVYPHTMFQFYNSLLGVRRLFDELRVFISEHADYFGADALENQLNECISNIESTLNIDTCNNLHN